MAQYELTELEVELIATLVHSSMNDEMLKEHIEDATGVYPEEIPELTSLQAKFPEDE